MHGDPQTKHFLTIFDWPVKHRVENVADEEKATIEELWGIANDTPNPSHQYLYCIPPKEYVEKKMRDRADIVEADTKKLPYEYFDGKELSKMIGNAINDWIAASGKYIRPGGAGLTNQPA